MKSVGMRDPVNTISPMTLARTIRVALVGNPNSGKTTIFNALTKQHEHVGNYSGVTVDKKEGKFNYHGKLITITDLPGTYSLTAQSLDEQIARDFVINEKPDVVVDIIDYSTIERNLYLMLQLIELKVPLVLVLNMSDVARQRGICYDLERLSEKLGVKIVNTVGYRKDGIDEIAKAVVEIANSEEEIFHPRVNYGRDIERFIKELSDYIQANESFEKNYNPRWVSLKLLENDEIILGQAKDEELLKKVKKYSARLDSIYSQPPEITIAERRYGFISGLCKRTVISNAKSNLTLSDKVDRVLTNRWLGIPIFLVLMYAMFQVTFSLGAYPMSWIESSFEFLSNVINGFWVEETTSPLRSLLVEGIIGGVGGVLIFLPNIMLLFLGISLLEDSGYMPRAAFVMDKTMQKLGLQGKSFIPMLVGFGCSIPAIMATRTIDNRRDRLVTMMVIPLMSCGARLPIYSLIIPAFFAKQFQAPMLFAIYIIGIILAVLAAKLLRVTLFKGENFPLIMELPPYRIPTLQSMFVHMWEKSWLYVRKAGTVILAISIVLWVLTSYPKPPEAKDTGATEQIAMELEYSVAGRIGKAIEPAIKLMGFDWRLGTAMIGAFAAKEVFVAQLGIVFAVGDESGMDVTLREKLKKAYTPFVGFLIMLFMLITMPCVATFAVTKAESGKWRYAFLQLGGLTTAAYLICVIVYQGGRLFGIG